MVDHTKGKDSSTMINSLEVFKHYTLLEAQPKTGRLHQIRAHLTAMKAPIAADDRYGAQQPYLSAIKRSYTTNRTGEELPMIQRFALHAHELKWTDLDNSELNVIAPYPKDFEVFLKLLRKYDLH